MSARSAFAGCWLLEAASTHVDFYCLEFCLAPSGGPCCSQPPQRQPAGPTGRPGHEEAHRPAPSSLGPEAWAWVNSPQPIVQGSRSRHPLLAFWLNQELGRLGVAGPNEQGVPPGVVRRGWQLWAGPHPRPMGGPAYTTLTYARGQYPHLVFIFKNKHSTLVVGVGNISKYLKRHHANPFLNPQIYWMRNADARL